jgi:hypothetical protein|tara:strand:+ start:381 stop:620 length:240 start_codon:yes stop_codon:yes gene_type:complete
MESFASMSENTVAVMDRTRAKTLKLTMKNSVSGIERLKHELTVRTDDVDPALIKELTSTIKQLKALTKQVDAAIMKAAE